LQIYSNTYIEKPVLWKAALPGSECTTAQASHLRAEAVLEEHCPIGFTHAEKEQIFLAPK